MRLMIFAFFFGILIFHTQIITLNIETQSHWILWVILIYLALLLLRYFYILPLPVKLGLAFLLGFIWITLHASVILAQALPEKLAGKNIILYGKIVSIPNKVNCRYSNPELNDWQFDFLPDKTKDYPNLSKIRLTWCDSFLPNLIPNGQWQFQVKLKKAHRPVNFSLPDYNKLLFQQRISITGKVKAAISYTPQFATLTHIRYQLAQHITTYLNDKPQTAALVIALTLGIKNWHPSIKKQYHIFKRTGTTHLFVISGLHLGAIAFITFWVSHFIWRHTTFILRLPALHFSSIISLIIVINYAFLAGFAVQTQRALIMVIAAMVGLLLSKRITLSHRFSLALLFVLLYDPLIIISLGFWLSFLSVAAILYIFETRHQLIQFYSQQVRYLSPDAVNSYLTFHYSQIGIIFILSPFLLYIFSQAPLSSFAANFIAIPSITFIILPLALISLFSVMILPALFSFIPLFLLTITAQLLDLLLILLASLSNHATVWQQFSPTLWAVIAAMIGGLILFLPKGFPARWLGLFWILPLFFPTFERPKYGEVKLTLLDVGQGLATVIETQNHTLVYDVGDSFAGQHVVAPYLNAHGIRYVDKLILSHDDNDHAGGLYALKERMKIDTILSSQPYQNMQKCISGQTWQWDNVQFEFLHPDKNYQDSRDNNMSCVLKIDNGKNSILLTGDIHQKIERRLSQHEKIDSDILVIPHHGSRTSSSLNFIQAVTPQLALFSAGYQNHFNHPHPTIQQRYRQQGIPTLNTAQVGAIQILLTQTGIKPARFAREVERHYWHD